VLAALGVDVGVVAITKADLAEPDVATAEAAELLPGAEIVAVSAKTGAGLDELRAAFDRAAARVPSRAEEPAGIRLHVDRVFTIRGAGTVVTGTLWSGAAGRGDEVTIQPAGRRARIRGVEVHDEPAERAEAGQRVALNLAGVDRDEVARGDVIVAGETIAPTYRVDAALQLEDRPKVVAVHHGTRETPARLVELGGRYFQLRLDKPIVPVRGDRLVIRSLAPPDTLGGGIVLDPAPRRHGPSRDLLARLARLERGEVIEEPAPPPAEKVAPELPPLTDSALATEARLKEAGEQPPLDSELSADDLAALRAHGRAVRLGPWMHVHPDALAAVQERLVAKIERDGAITLAGARDELGTSRKYAQAYLEHLDAVHVTLRRGDVRVLRRRSAHP
jgi:selenocysteine-specific elongation factor